MNQSDRNAGLPLQHTQVTEQRCDLAGDIFIDGMDSHQRIEDEKHRVMDANGGFKPVLIIGTIQTESFGRYDLDIEA
jgi:hypothetical protein